MLKATSSHRAQRHRDGADRQVDRRRRRRPRTFLSGVDGHQVDGVRRSVGAEDAVGDLAGQVDLEALDVAGLRSCGWTKPSVFSSTPTTSRPASWICRHRTSRPASSPGGERLVERAVARRLQVLRPRTSPASAEIVVDGRRTGGDGGRGGRGGRLGQLVEAVEGVGATAPPAAARRARRRRRRAAAAAIRRSAPDGRSPVLPRSRTRSPTTSGGGRRHRADQQDERAARAAGDGRRRRRRRVGLRAAVISAARRFVDGRAPSCVDRSTATSTARPVVRRRRRASRTWPWTAIVHRPRALADALDLGRGSGARRRRPGAERPGQLHQRAADARRDVVEVVAVRPSPSPAR